MDSNDTRDLVLAICTLLLVIILVTAIVARLDIMPNDLAFAVALLLIPAALYAGYRIGNRR